MRLLNTTTLEVVSPRDDEIPPYAILSHTWGRDDEEVTFQDLQILNAARKTKPGEGSSHPIARRPGFIKIRRAARLAWADKLHFIWIDTCCIDKTSSAELSEAINSMFSYYQRAEVCYAFLSDIADPDLQDRIDVSTIATSRWFSRGWTLQELIAPPEVRFYSSNWRFLGSKGSRQTLSESSHSSSEETDKTLFLSMLEKVTDIDKGLLDGTSDLGEFGVATRMKWASRRQTTRVEDRAYCLMGLFAVNMPLLYGEGINAFLRLQEAILLTTDDQSMFAWTCPKSEDYTELSGLLAKSPAWFQESGHIKPLPSNIISDSTPWSMTNVGLRATLAIFPLPELAPREHGYFSQSENLFAAILDCSPYRSRDTSDQAIYKPAVALMQLGGDQYARFDPTTLLNIPVAASSQHIDVARYRSIYIKQKPVTLSPPEIYLDDQKIHSRCSLVQVRKLAGVWDEATKTARCKRVGKDGLLCAFRYRRFSRWVDVLVGTHGSAQLSVGLARFWCHIEPVNSNARDRRIVAFSDPASFTTKDSFMDIHAQISVGDGKPMKYGNITLKLHNLRIPPDLDYLGIRRLSDPSTRSGERGYAPGQREISHIFAQLTGNLAEIYEMVTNRTETSFAKLPVLKDIEPESADSNSKSEPAFLPVRYMNTSGPIINGIIAFFLDKGSLTTFSDDVEKLMRGALSCIRIGEIPHDTAKGPLNLKFLYSEKDLLKVIPMLDDMEMVDRHLWLTKPTKTPKAERSGRNVYWTYPSDTPHIGFAIIHYVVARNHLNALERLIGLDHRAQFCKLHGFFTPLHLACTLGHYQAAEILLRNSEKQWIEVLSEISEIDHPLSLAMAYVRDQRIEKFVSYFRSSISVADPHYDLNWVSYTQNSFDETPLHRAAALDNVVGLKAVASQLTERDNSRIDCRDARKRTPLWHAASAGSYNALAYLLDQGADMSARDIDGITIVHAACRAPFDPAKLVGLLLSRGADPNAYIKFDSQWRWTPPILITPCFDAALRNDSETLRILLKYRASPGTSSAEKSSINPLHVAAMNGYEECVRILCNSGLELNTFTPYIVRVDLSKIVEVDETKAREDLHKWLKETKTKKKLKQLRAVKPQDWPEEDQKQLVHLQLEKLGEMMKEKQADKKPHAKTSYNLSSDGPLRWLEEGLEESLSRPLKAALRNILGNVEVSRRVQAPTVLHISLEGPSNGGGKSALQLARDGGYQSVVSFLEQFEKV